MNDVAKLLQEMSLCCSHTYGVTMAMQGVLDVRTVGDIL